MAKLNVISDVAYALLDKCDFVYKQAVPGETTTFQTKRDNDDVKDLTWSLSNLCRGGFKTAEYWEQYLAAFNAFSQCIFFENNAIWSEAWYMSIEYTLYPLFKLPFHSWGLSRILSNMFDNDFFYHRLDLNPRLYTRLISLIR